MPQYAELIAAIKSLPLKERIPGIEEYVFGVNYETVKSRIDNILGTYLFVDFGELNSQIDSNGRINDRFHMAVTIAGKISNSTSDLVEQAIISDQTLSLINELRACMLADQKSHPWLQEINKSITISPFTSLELASLGWSMDFYREGADMCAIKDKVNIHLQNQ